jgi:hypothetical protein
MSTGSPTLSFALNLDGRTVSQRKGRSAVKENIECTKGHATAAQYE